MNIELKGSTSAKSANRRKVSKGDRTDTKCGQRYGLALALTWPMQWIMRSSVPVESCDERVDDAHERTVEAEGCVMGRGRKAAGKKWGAAANMPGGEAIIGGHGRKVTQRGLGELQLALEHSEVAASDSASVVGHCSQRNTQRLHNVVTSLEMSSVSSFVTVMGANAFEALKRREK
ncbi:hypothetical protein BDN70DRAFT_901778 [Pholiota conissans]|uniref:Uncharacterized protein n=1 Tax=Pholiota conissans TaxID=109636 RepID=A0A9P6CSS6_9AGAR|nr:hypothetical protein BDN70DRAFT_901778 [Pholiota conissans]